MTQFPPVFDCSAHLLRAESFADECMGHAQLNKVEKAQIKRFDVEFFEPARPKARVLPAANNVASEPTTDFRRGDVRERRSLGWGIHADANEGKVLFHRIDSIGFSLLLSN